MKVMFSQANNENGFVLVTAMMVLIVLTLIGIIAMNNSTTERMISGNDRTHKKTFYQADAGTELAQHVAYHNAMCLDANGFTSNSVFGGNPAALLNGSIRVEDLLFADFTVTAPATVSAVSDTNRAFAFYPDANVNDGAPHTNFLTTFTTGMNAGAPQQMVSAYDAPIGQGQVAGTHRRFTIASQHFGLDNSQSLIQVRWRIDNSIISSAASSDCVY